MSVTRKTTPWGQVVCPTCGGVGPESCVCDISVTYCPACSSDKKGLRLHPYDMSTAPCRDPWHDKGIIRPTLHG